MHPENFWRHAAAAIDWSISPNKVLDPKRLTEPSWFADGVLNTCFNAVDRHILAGRGDQPALITSSAMTGETGRLSFTELRDAVAQTAGALIDTGVTKGDRVVIYMPMVGEAIIAMLACARIGAIHSVVFGGFAPEELGKRIHDAAPKLILTASCGLEPGRVIDYVPLVRTALVKAQASATRVVVLQRPRYEAALPAGWLDWKNWLGAADPADCVPVAASDPLYILYTSGTTGTPKGIVRDNGGHAVALTWSMQHVFDAGPGDVFWAASDIGWVVGHSYIVYGPLLAGCTTLVFEGKPVGTPDAGTFWRNVERFGVRTLFTAPTAIRAIRREDPTGALIDQYDTSTLAALFLAGERTDPETLRWSRERLGVPVIDNWWQTELGWPALAQCQGLAENVATAGSAGRPVPGFAVEVVNNDSQPCSAEETGDVVIRLPLPPGSATALWHDDNGFTKHYLRTHDGFYTTGDNGYIDTDGSVFIMGRTDDLINVAGHRLSTGAMEAAVAAVGDVAECAVVGLADELKGQVPVALVVRSSASTEPNANVERAVIASVREAIGPVAALKRVVFVERLPKTRSGKVLRKTLRALAAGEHVETPPTIEDPGVIDAIRAALQPNNEGNAQHETG